jgi:hypothetical protein
LAREIWARTQQDYREEEMDPRVKSHMRQVKRHLVSRIRRSARGSEAVHDAVCHERSSKTGGQALMRNHIYINADPGSPRRCI